jgi:hypothetical protein
MSQKDLFSLLSRIVSQHDKWLSRHTNESQHTALAVLTYMSGHTSQYVHLGILLYLSNAPSGHDFQKLDFECFLSVSLVFFFGNFTNSNDLLILIYILNTRQDITSLLIKISNSKFEL